jgi:Zn-dependent peptidase ImmA (M78 family)
VTLLEALCEELHQQGVDVYEKPMAKDNKGLYGGNVIWINEAMNHREKACTLAEEEAHYLTSTGNILDQRKAANRKQEGFARRIAYEKLIPLQSLVEASREGIKNRYELADYLEVTEEFLDTAIHHYREKYGLYTTWTSYVIYFDPLGVFEIYD